MKGTKPKNKNGWKIILPFLGAMLLSFLSFGTMQHNGGLQPVLAKSALLEPLQWTDLGNVVSPATASYALAGTADGKLVGGTYDGGPLLYAFDISSHQITSAIPVPRSGGMVEVVVEGEGSSVYANISRAFQPGYLIEYDTITGAVSDLGDIGGEYGYGLTVGIDGKVYVGSCCAGSLKRYDPNTGNWLALGQTLGSNWKITGLTTDAEGWVYAVTGTVLSSGGAQLYRIDPETLAPAFLAQLWPGLHDAWNLAYNTYDNALYITVSTNMTARLFRYDLQGEAPQDLGEIVPGITNVYPGQMTIAGDGKVYLGVGPDLLMYDPDVPTSGIVSLGTRGINGRPLTFGSDGRMYGLSGTHLMRNENLYFNIAGRITDNAGYPSANVAITYEDGVVYTDLNGYYDVNGLSPGTYILTPTLTDYEFSPPTRTVTVAPSATVQNFTALACTIGQGPPEPGSQCISRPPSFDLPVRTQDTSNPYMVGLLGSINNEGPGRVRSWFDHTLPNQTLNQNITLYTGNIETTGVITGLNSTRCTTGSTCYDGHEGIDFSPLINQTSEYVYAAAHGIVKDIKENCPNNDFDCGSYLGNQVKIDHGGGYLSIYGHLAQNEIYVDVGDEVDESTILGIMGTTGNSTGIHLHFEVRYDPDEVWPYSSHIDPYGCWDPGMDCWTSQSAGWDYLWKYPLASMVYLDHAGGLLESPSALFTATVPPESLESQMLLQLMDIPPGDAAGSTQRLVTSGFRLRSQPGESTLQQQALNVEFQFNLPVTVQASYEPTNTLHLDLSQLSLYRLDTNSGEWQILSSSVDPISFTVQAETLFDGDFSLQAPLLCTAEIDEPNDFVGNEVGLSTNGTAHAGIFDIDEDEDWYWFTAERNHSYLLQTSNLSTTVDTIIELYDFSGSTLLGSDDNSGGGQASLLAWTAPNTGRYLLRVIQAVGSGNGCDASYEVTITDLSPELEVTHQLDDIGLLWTNSPYSTLYEVWRSGEAYFVAGEPGAEKIADVLPPGSGLAVNYIDSNVGNDGIDYYYQIKAINPYIDAISNYAGKVVLALPPGWNLFSWPLLPADTILDAMLGTGLFGTADPQTADRVLVWNGDSQSYDTAWFCGGPVCETFGDDYYNHWLANDYSQSSLTLEPDSGFWLQNRSGVTETLVLVGAVTQDDRFVTVGQDWQLLGSAFPATVPLDEASIPANGTADPQTADRILYWDTATQSYQSAWFCGGPVCETFGEDYYNHWLANDYSPTTLSIIPGQGFWYLNHSDPFIWTNLSNAP